MSRLADRNLSSPPTDPKELERRRLARGKAFEHEVDLEALADEATSPGIADLLDETFEAWRRRGPLRPLGDARYVVRVEPAGENAFDDPARLCIEVHPPGEKRPFTPDDLDGRRLPAREWRIFESLARSPVGQRDFLAENENACLFLARAAEADLILEAPGEDGEIKFDEIPRKPSLVFRAAEPGRPTGTRFCRNGGPRSRKKKNDWKKRAPPTRTNSAKSAGVPLPACSGFPRNRKAKNPTKRPS